MLSLKEILAELVRYPSITPEDAGCQDFMIGLLEKWGFECQRFDKAPVANFFARFGQGKPLLVFAGHTDVVPVGDVAQWQSPPFSLLEKEGIAYGRGTADMKGSLASMLIAAQRWVKHHPTSTGSLGFLITSGEEGDHYDAGTPYVMEALQRQGVKIDYCIVGEPSSTQALGDVIKIGRRGSLTAKLTLEGKQGHVAYPHLAINPIHQLSPVLLDLCTRQWDEGDENFPPTSLQITHVHAGGQADNIIPGNVILHLNVRYSPKHSAASLRAAIEECFARHQLQPSIQWRHSGEPFLTAAGPLLDACIESIKTSTGSSPDLSTSGGTSDARFIAPYGIEVIELGPINASIHQVNEHVCLNDLDCLADVYYQICKHLCGT
jgi:succinyl-diaminopimelate desuccinylase